MAQPMITTVGALATADQDGVSLSQTAAAAQYLVINGALAAGTFDADSICASQTPSGAGALVINGALATTNPVAGAGGTADAGGATVRFSTPQRIYISSGANISNRTFAVVGTVQTPTSFGPGAVVSETITGPNNNVVASTNLYSTIISITISGSAAGALTVGHSGTATMDKARRVAFTSAADDSDITFTIAGTDWNNNVIGEVLTGASGATATSVLSYKTVTSILTSGATSGALEVGSSAIADSPWVRFDDFAANSQVSIQCTVSGTVNYTVRQTMEDPNYVTNQLPTPTYQWTPASVAWLDHPDTALVAATATKQGNYGYAPIWAKVVLNSGTGSVTSVFRQAYMN